MTMTTRDEVWARVILLQLPRLEKFKRSDLGFNDGKRHTVQRVLAEMEDIGLLERNREHGSWYLPGPLAKAIYAPSALSTTEREEVEQFLEELREETDISDGSIVPALLRGR